jgi:Fur family transcriptional regulator, iron response regulator
MRPMFTPCQSRSELAQRLRKNGIQPTPQRIEIAFALFSRHEHLCAEEIMAIANERQAATSKATVYNTLNLLVEKGMIREVIMDASKTFYDPNTEPHFHMYDVTRGRLTDIDSSGVNISGLPAVPDGLRNEGVDLILRVRS